MRIMCDAQASRSKSCQLISNLIQAVLHQKNDPPKFDSFDRWTVKNAAISLIAENKNLDLNTLRNYLRNEKDLNITKFSLWKMLHSLGFRYGRVDRNKMGLYERSDIVKRRIDYLREIERVRRSGRYIIFLDETWVDTNCYPKTQWIALEVFQQRGVPIIACHWGLLEERVVVRREP